VEQYSFFFNITEEVPAFGETEVYQADVMIDYTDRRFDFFVIFDKVFYSMLAGEVVCLAFRFCDDENIEIGFVFVCDMAFCVYIFDLRPTGV